MPRRWNLETAITSFLDVLDVRALELRLKVGWSHAYKILLLLFQNNPTR